MTIKEALQKGRKYFKGMGIDPPSIEVLYSTALFYMMEELAQIISSTAIRIFDHGSFNERYGRDSVMRRLSGHIAQKSPKSPDPQFPEKSQFRKTSSAKVKNSRRSRSIPRKKGDTKWLNNL